MEIRYRRPGRPETVHRQELLHDGQAWKATLLVRDPEGDPREVDGELRLPGGAILLWFTFPGAWHEVAAFHDPEGRLLGHYTNVVRPARPEGRSWLLEDLCLDVWQPRRGRPRILDREELREARERGWIRPADAERAEREAERVLTAARTGRWPPPPVRTWRLETVPGLRLWRDRPGTFWAALISGRLIAWGLYVMGAVSVTSVAFAAFTDAFVVRGAAETAWLITLSLEAAALAPLALGGRLPATRWPRPALTDERTLFIGTLAAGVAVLALQEAALWRSLLTGVYGVLGLFCLIFTACRSWFDRTFPGFAVAGLALSMAALLALALL